MKKIIIKSRKTIKVKLKEARKYFEPLASKIILFGTAYEQRLDLVFPEGDCKDVAEFLFELKKRREGTWKGK